MKEKKKLAGWQFGIMLGLQIIFFSTMFIPIFHINKNVIKNMAEDTNEILKDYGEIGLEELLQIGDIDDLIEDFDMNEINEFERQRGIKITSTTPVRIMTHSLVKFIYGNKASDQEVKKAFDESVREDIELRSIATLYNTSRVLFYIIYILDIVVMVLTIISFTVGWSKIIPNIINSIYGLLGAIMYGLLRFGFFRMIANKILDDLFKELGDLSKLIDRGQLTNIYVKMLNNFFAAGPLIAFITALLLLVLSIVCMFAGGTPVGRVFIPPVEPPYDPTFPPEPEPFKPVPTPDPVPITPTPIPIPTPAPAPIPAPIPQPVIPEPTAYAGKVMCTKGVAVGQGFQLPVDRKVIVGKSPSKANLVINNQNVSNVHCSIRYNAAHNSYIIKDHSTNGTFVNGVKLPADTPVEYPAGTVLSLADGTNEITLG